MSKGLIGRKLGMSHVYDETGAMVSVTVLEVGPCAVSQVKTVEKDGYSALQLAYGDVRESLLTYPEKQHLSKCGISPKRYLKEFKFEGNAPEAGSVIKASDIFSISDKVKVSVVTKGKGFQGVVKKHGFSGGPESHGSRFQRHPGSIGACSTPSRVFKGIKLPGRMGGVKRTVGNLKVVKIIEDKNIILVAGSVPGQNRSIVTITKQG